MIISRALMVHARRKPSQFVTARLIPMLHYYKSLIPKKNREYKTTVVLSAASTCSIAILSCEQPLVASCKRIYR